MPHLVLLAVLMLLLAMLVAQMISAGASSFSDVASLFGVLFGIAGSFVAALIVLGLVHEAGHAIVGRLVGCEVFGVTIGRGRLHARASVASTVLEFRGALIGGVTVLNVTGRRGRDAAMLFAGVGFELIVGLAMFGWTPDGTIGTVVRWSVLGAVAADLVVNLLPMTAPSPSPVLLRTDGRRLLTLVTMDAVAWHRTAMSDRVSTDDARLAQAIYGGDDAASLELATSRADSSPGDVDAALLLATLLMADGRWRDAHDRLMPFVEDEPPRPVLQNNAAWSAVMTFDRALLPIADRLSEQAFHADPTSAAFANTRGATLTLSGRADEGIGFSRLSAQGKGLTGGQRAFVLCFLALAEHDCGNARAADGHLRRAAILDPACSARPHVERLMSEGVRSGVASDGSHRSPTSSPSS